MKFKYKQMEVDKDGCFVDRKDVTEDMYGMFAVLARMKHAISEGDQSLILKAATGFDEIQIPPIPMILHCPCCRMKHIDEPSLEDNWGNPPHKTHLCGGCGHLWRPSFLPTEGVNEL